MIQAEVLTIDHIIKKIKNGILNPIDYFSLKLETIYPMYVPQFMLVTISETTLKLFIRSMSILTRIHLFRPCGYW